MLNNDADTRRAEEILWRRGEIDYLLHPDAQRRLFDFTDSWKKKHGDSAKPIVWDMHRGMGKTFSLVLYGIRRAIKYPGQEIRFVAPTQTQCEELVRPNIEKILEHCPSDLLPMKVGDHYIFKNPQWSKNTNWNYTWRVNPRPSYFRLLGCREKADNHRGKRSNVVLFDECREMDPFEYIARTVFGPHFVTMWNPVQIMSSTPPESMDHPWSSLYCTEAERDGRYFKCPVTENKDWTQKDERMMIELFIPQAEGLQGEELEQAKVASIDWQREMACAHISDPTRMIVPEFVEPGCQEAVVVKEWKRPDFFNPITVIDFGYQDFTAALFFYIDFQKALLVIEDELWVHQKNSADLKKLIVEKEEAVWGKAPFNSPIRHGDLPPQMQADLAELLQFVVIPVDKTERAASINACRLSFRLRRLRIHERCTHLIYQLRNGRYAKNRKDFQRSESESLKDKMGHCDLLAALIYGHRMANWDNNPYPRGTMQVGNNFTIPIPADPGDGTLEILEEHEFRLT